MKASILPSAPLAMRTRLEEEGEKEMDTEKLMRRRMSRRMRRRRKLMRRHLNPSNPSSVPLSVSTGARAYALAIRRFLSSTITWHWTAVRGD